MDAFITMIRAVFLLGIIGFGLAGCSEEIAREQLSAGLLPPVVNPISEVNQSLRDLPPPSSKLVAAVYDYADQTGQFKPSDTGQTLSRAVTQGATSVLIKALQDVGEGSWFTVVEREKVSNLLKERQIITQMRMTYLGEQKISPQALPPLLFAAIIFEGGIIGFDSNTQTGGVGAGLLGIRADVKYRLDTITVYLRAVSTKTGQVLASVTTHKTIASVGVQGGVFKYVAFDEILEAEAGVTKNEPDQLAVQQAIEKAVHTIVVTGAEQNIWSFADGNAQAALVKAKHEAETRTATITPEEVEAKPQAALQEDGWITTSVRATPAKTEVASANSMASGPAGESTSQGWGGILMTMNRGQEDQEAKRPE